MSKYTKLEDVIGKIVNTPTKVITDDLPALVDRQHEIIDMLADLPTIEVGGLIDRRCFTGKWKDHYYPHFEVAGIECSVCGKDVPYWSRHNEIPKYCPNCGVRMEIEE